MVIKKQGLRMCRCSSSYKPENQGKLCHEYQKQNSWRSLKQFADFLTENVIYNRGKYIAFVPLLHFIRQRFVYSVLSLQRV